MFPLMTPLEAQQKIAENCRLARLQMGLTQAALARRAEVALPTLRRFEQQGAVSLENLIKLLGVLGGLAELLAATAPLAPPVASIEDVLRRNEARKRQRGLRSQNKRSAHG